MNEFKKGEQIILFTILRDKIVSDIFNPILENRNESTTIVL